MRPHWDIGLLCLSIALAMLASYAALEFAARVARAKAVIQRSRWHLTGAVALGMGAWSVHMTSILALQPPFVPQYDPLNTFAALLVATLTCGAGLRSVSSGRPGQRQLLLGSLGMGTGVLATHIVGTSVLHVAPAMHRDPKLMVACVALAYLAAYLALRLSGRVVQGTFRPFSAVRVRAAVLTGLAFAAMQYAGLAAINFDPDATSSGGFALTDHWAALIIALATIAVVAVALVAAFLTEHLEQRAAVHRHMLLRVGESLQYQNQHDGLTDLPNRDLFMTHLRQAISEASANAQSLAVLVLDLDRFKIINDAIGHGAGDLVLQSTARRLSAALRAHDTVARPGGDEFLVLLRSVGGIDDAVQTGSRLLELLREPHLVEGLETYATASIGISIYPQHAMEAEELVSHADEAMYKAKRLGRDRLCLFSQNTSVYTPERLKLESDLRRAVDRNQLELHYQPQVAIKSGDIVGLEALVRWRHPEEGLVPPDRFIGIAEETGLIGAIGGWVLGEACRQMRAWKDSGLPDLRMAINLSASQFEQEHLPSTVFSALEQYRLAPQWLELELTESTIMSDVAQSVHLLEAIRAMGVQIAIDDFGTGYSSLSYLKRLPISRLKIDRGFISDLGASNESDSIAHAIVSLGRSLGIQVIAEGVETLEQLECLRALGCDEYQGFFCSRALPANEVVTLIRDWQFQRRRKARVAAVVTAIR
jgi:diguanylate cyclase (GGDEF)-like protein